MWSTPGGKVKRPATGDPVRISADNPSNDDASASAMTRERRR
jgi:hypothetical protein